jgi:hypothetical protein
MWDRGVPGVPLAVVVIALLPLPLAAQADTCAEATEIGVGTFSGDTSGASSDGGSSCGRSLESPDRWFRHTASRETAMVVDTCGSDYDTVLSLHSGCPGTTSNEIACNDDRCSSQSRVWAIVEAGTTYWIRVSGYEGAAGPFTLRLAYQDLPQGESPDLVVTDLRALAQRIRVGGEIACTLESKACNLGGEALDWFPNPHTNHPFFVFNVYRLRQDRFEQIGQSWVKHAFSVTQEDGCGVVCLPTATVDNQLGVGCQDIYSVGANFGQEHFGPRHEVNPWTGQYTFEGSHLDVTAGEAHGPLDHRLRLRDRDLDYADARCYIELFVVSAQDADPMNSIGWEQVGYSGEPGGTWSFETELFRATVGPALDAWEGATRTVIPEKLVHDGRCILAAKVTSKDDSTWHYEYALYNHDMDRGVSSFTIPVVASTTLSSVGFHAVLSHGEGYSNDSWEWQRDDRSITWSTADNPLRWGTLYNFRFDADVGPTESSVAILGLFKPGKPTELSGPTVGPTTGAEYPMFKRGDANGDGRVDLADAIALVSYLFLGHRRPRCFDAADSNDSNVLDIADAIYMLMWLFSGGHEPPAPGPVHCGVDNTPTDSPFPECVYAEERC